MIPVGGAPEGGARPLFVLLLLVWIVLNGSLDGYRYRVESEQVRLIKRAEPGKAGGSGESLRLEGLDMEIWETRRIR